MKKTISFALILFTFVSLAMGQAELPKKPAQRPQTGGPEGQVRPTKPITNYPSYPRPVYRPRPAYYPPGVYYPQQYPTNNPTTNAVRDVAAENRAKAEYEVKKAIFELRAEQQSFDVTDVTKEFEIVGNKGFRIVFPELAFVDEEGNPVLGEVEVKLKEFTDNSEFAEAGLTTMTTDGQLLETGGMIDLQAYSGDKKLSMAPGKEVEINVPQMKDQEGFRVFYARGSETITWSTDPASQNTDTASKAFDGYTIKMLKSTQTINGKPANFVIFRNWKPLDEYVNENLKVPANLRERILKDGIPFVYTLEFNGMGKIKSVTPKYPEYSKNSLISEIQGKIKGILMDAPPLALNDGNLENKRSYDIVFATAKNYTQTGPVFLSAPMAQNENKQVSAAETNAKPSSANVNEFAMNSSQLTKINCDRFSGSNSKDTQHFVFDRADAIVYVVFKDQRSFIQPAGSNGNYMLTKVPTGSNVRYVAVVYGDDGSVKMGVKDTQTSNGQVAFTDYQNFSAEALKTALNN